MVSHGNRLYYVSENFSSSEENSCEDTDYQSRKEDGTKIIERQRRKPRCLSKNALMARENRLKKKIYVNKLEREVTSLKQNNKKLTTVVKNQSLLVTDLKREVQYLKSVVANSSDIKNLIKNISSSTGMLVSTSLDSNLSMKNVSIPKKTLANPEPSLDSFSPTHDLFGDDLNMDYFADFPLLTPENDVFNENVSIKSSLEEHNYTTTPLKDEDVGVCLHVSKHRVSLEFCPNCNENAQESWAQL